VNPARANTDTKRPRGRFRAPGCASARNPAWAVRKSSRRATWLERVGITKRARVKFFSTRAKNSRRFFKSASAKIFPTRAREKFAPLFLKARP